MKKISAVFLDPLFKSTLIFSFPVVIDQFFTVVIHLVTLSLVKKLGPVATSAVGLGDAVINLMAQISSYIATAGGIIIAQLLGANMLAQAKKAAKQGLYVGFLVVCAMTAVVWIFRQPLMFSIFGRSAPDVFSSVLSYAGIALAGTPITYFVFQGYAMLRATGNSKLPMFINIVTVVVNAISGYVFIAGVGSFKSIGVAGAGYALVVSRLFAAVIIAFIIFGKNFSIAIDFASKFKPDFKIIKRIYAIAVPAVAESAMFMTGKLLIQSFTTLLSTTAIAANSVTNSVASIMWAPAMAYGVSSSTTVAKAVGQGDEKTVKRTANISLLQSFSLMLILNILIFIFLKPIIAIHTNDPQTASQALSVLRISIMFAIVFYAVAFTMPGILRGTGDAKYAMYVANGNMLVRVILAYILAIKTPLGILGLWIPMYLDWMLRTVFYGMRYLSGKWLKKCDICEEEAN